MRRENVHQNSKRENSRRLLAFVLAFVFLIGVLPYGLTPTVFADDEPIEDNMLQSVGVSIRVNGQDNFATASIAPGTIADNISEVYVDGLPEGTEFIKAVVFDNTDGSETEISGVGSYQGKTYYSVDKTANIGTQASDQQTVILVYAAKYNLSVNKQGEGTYAILGEDNVVSGTVSSDQDIIIQKIKPATDYTISSISYQSGPYSGAISIVNGTATIPQSAIRGDIVITIPFDAVESYSINDARTMNNSKYYPKLKNQDNHGGTSAQSYNATTPLPTFTPNGNATFYIYSQSHTGGDTYLLNMLSINGRDVKYPTGKTINSEETTTYDDGSSVKVKLIQTSMHFNSESSSKKRTMYEVTVSGFHENVEVAYYFKEEDERTLIIKGLNGIDLTGASVENSYLLDRYYTLQTNNQNIYTTAYTWMGDWTGDGASWRPSNNLIVYTVKPGYNPYTITTSVYYNDEEQDSSKIRDTDKTGTPEEVIADAGNDRTGHYDTNYRYWGTNTSLKNRDDNYHGFVGKSVELMLTTLNESGEKWYAIALSQNAEKNQQLYLNAHPYEYRMVLDLDGGTLTDNRFVEQNGLLVEGAMAEEDGEDVFVSAKHRHTDTNAYVELPSMTPEKMVEEEDDQGQPIIARDNYIFEGWQLLYDNGEPVDGAIYQSMDRIPVTETLIDELGGDVKEDLHDIKLKAVWKNPASSNRTTVSITGYVQIPDDSTQYDENEVVNVNGKTYWRFFYAEELQDAGKPAAVLNLHRPEENPDYYELCYGTDGEGNELTKLATTTVRQTDISVIPEDNQLRVYYDYKTVEFSVEKIAKGKIKAKTFDITVILSAPSSGNSPVSVDQAEYLIKPSNNSNVTKDGNALIYTMALQKGEKVTFMNVPYKWEYSVSEPPAENGEYETSYSPTASGSGLLAENTDVVVTNTGKNPGIEVSKDLDPEPDENGERSITLESYATGETYTEYLEGSVPLDIAIVVDQSGSMSYDDVGTIYTGTTKAWKASDVDAGTQYFAYDSTDKKYYPVRTESGPLYSSAGTQFKVYEEFHDEHSLNPFGGRSWGNESDNSLYYYRESDKTMHLVYYNTKTTGVSTRLADLAFYVTLFYFTDSTSGSAPSSSSSFNTAIAQGTVKRLGPNTDNFASDWYYTWKYFDISGDHDYYNGTLYKKTGEGKNAICYTRDNGTVVTLGTTCFAGDTIYTGRLYTEKRSTRLKAMKDSIGSFVDQVAAQAKQNDVDHRVSVIGFANNEIPSSSITTIDHIIGDSKYITTNTGLFVNGVFKNYMTPDFTNNKPVSTDDFYSIIEEAYSRAATDDHTSFYPGTVTNEKTILGVGNRYYTTHYEGGRFTNLTFFTRDGFPIRRMITKIAYGTNNHPITNSVFYNQYLHPDSNKNLIWEDYAAVTNFYDNVTAANRYTTATQSTNYNDNSFYLTWNNWSRDWRYDSAKYHTTQQPYYPRMINLTEDDYHDSLISIGVNDGGEQFGGNGVNDYIDQAVDTLDAYGATYIGYGMSMANSVFENNPIDEGEKRKRVIIVFTDGMPGDGSEFDDDAANEALAAASVAKDKYGASVYTIGLYPEGSHALSEGDQLKAEQFLHELSSEYFSSTSNVYEDDLLIDESYYFTDESGRTHAVRFERDSYPVNSNYSFNGTALPENNSNCRDVRYYNSDKSEGTCIRGSDNKLYYFEKQSDGKYYYYQANLTSPKWENELVGDREIPITSNLGGPHEQSIWKDSDEWLRGSKFDENDSRTSSDNIYQFFKVNPARYVLEEDDDPYCFITSDASGLNAMFDQISESVQYPTSTVSLDGTTAYMMDTITADFDIPLDSNGKPDMSKIKVYTVEGTLPEGAAVPTFADTREPFPDAIVDYNLNSDGTKTLTVRGFDYSQNYIAKDHPGCKLVVTIDGLTPAEGYTGVLYSNTDDSGVYKVNDDGGTTLIAEFNRPSITVDPLMAKVALYYEGIHSDSSQTFSVKFTLTNSKDDPYSGTYGDGSFSSQGVYTTTLGNSQFRTFNNIPPGAKLTMEVADPHGETIYYHYTIKEDGTLEPVISNTNIGTVVINDDKPNIEIRIADTRQLLTVTNNTIGYSESEDYSDKTKKFPINITLFELDDDGETYSQVNGRIKLLDESGNTVTFNNGVYTVNLADAQSKGFYIPNGYKVVVEDAESFSNYDTTYQTGQNVDPLILTDPTEESQEIILNNDWVSVVNHKLNIDIIPTGLFGGSARNAAIPFAVCGVLLLIGLYFYVQIRRKRNGSGSKENTV